MSKQHCGTCGGYGLENSECPECSKPPISPVLPQIVSAKQDVSVIAKELKSVSIPLEYVGLQWNPESFWAAHGNLRNNRMVSFFIEQQSKVQALFMSGQLPKQSAIFMAPYDFGKLSWAYSCMQHALKFGYTVAPLLDTQEIKRMFTLAGERPLDKPLCGIDYDTYVESDVCFFTVVKCEQRRTAYQTIFNLMDKRARRGLPTIGLSRFAVSELSSWDRSGGFKKLKEYSPHVNPNKVPVIISCL